MIKVLGVVCVAIGTILTTTGGAIIDYNDDVPWYKRYAYFSTKKNIGMSFIVIGTIILAL